MSKKKDVCALCNEIKPLQKSHIIPKGVIRRIKNHSQEEIVTIIRNKNANTSYMRNIDTKGETTYLLCRECEQLFSKNETYFFNNILDLLRNNKSVPEKNYRSNEFNQFVLSLIWRIGTLELIDRDKIDKVIENINLKENIDEVISNFEENIHLKYLTISKKNEYKEILCSILPQQKKDLLLQLMIEFRKVLLFNKRETNNYYWENKFGYDKRFKGAMYHNISFKENSVIFLIILDGFFLYNIFTKKVNDKYTISKTSLLDLQEDLNNLFKNFLNIEKIVDKKDIRNFSKKFHLN